MTTRHTLSVNIEGGNARETYGILNVIIQRTIPRSSFSGLEAELRSKTFDSAEVSPRN